MEILRYDRGTHPKERKYDMKHWNERGPGLLLCLCIAIPCWMLGRALPVIGGPVFAILAGMAIALLVRDKGRAQAGIAYTSKTILQYAVILLGFGLNLSEVAKVGLQSLPIILSTITTSLVVSFLLHRLLHIPSNISTLVGVGSSVCGGSAIAATAPVIGADDEEIAQSISVIFLFNVAAALQFPTLGGLLGLGNEGFGMIPLPSRPLPRPGTECTPGPTPWIPPPLSSSPALWPSSPSPLRWLSGAPPGPGGQAARGREASLSGGCSPSSSCSSCWLP